MNRRHFVGLSACGLAGAPIFAATDKLAVTGPESGLRLMLSAKPERPILKVLLPEQPDTERGIEIELPEHAWGRIR